MNATGVQLLLLAHPAVRASTFQGKGQDQGWFLCL